MDRKSTRRSRHHSTFKRSSTVRRSTRGSPQYSPHLSGGAFDFDLHDLSTEDIQYITRNTQKDNDFQIHHKISDAIALYGVKVNNVYTN